MKTICVGFTDYFKGMDEYFIDVLSKRFNVVRDDSNPEYLFFADETFGTQNLQYDVGGFGKFRNRLKKKVFYTGENRRPQNYKAHAYISFDHIVADNHIRLPLYVIDYWIMEHKLGMPSLANRLIDRQKHWDFESKTRFCCFISGNGGQQMRNEWFAVLNGYKNVDAAGPLFNNIGRVIPRGDDAAKNKDEFMRPYKFNMCFENGSYPGYCTEKLFHAFYMGTIPIYWGDPCAAGMDFNPNAFINWHDKENNNKFMSQIVRLDQNKDDYKEMYLEPVFLGGAQKYYNKYFNTDRFNDWFEKVVL